MAAVHTHIPTRIASPVHRSSTKHASRSHPPTSDPYYGHELPARIAANFVAHLFTCPDYPPPNPNAPQPSIKLEYFIAYALHRTRLHESVNFAALYLLQRLKARFPAAKGSSGHRLFISAYMLASKIICDDTYSNKSWCIVAQHMFQLREINQMEREMCSYLEWQLNVEPKVLRDFQDRVKRDFAGPGPYPTLVQHEPTPEPASHASAGAPFSSSRPTVSVTPASGPFPAASATQPSPSSSDEDGDATAPSTPESSHSNTTSPASTVSPPTPPDAMQSYPVEIAGESRAHRSATRTHKPRRMSSADAVAVPTPAPMPRPPRVREVSATAVDPYANASERDDIVIAPRGTRKRGASPASGGRSKLQVGRDMYAYASRTVW